MVTLRGVDFASVKAQVEQASQWLSIQGTGQTSPQEDRPYCPLHKVALKQQHKDGRTWYSHRVADERRWCKGKLCRESGKEECSNTSRCTGAC